MSDKLGKVVIIGGGIIGCSIAYHLAELGVKCVVVERTKPACGASGKAGGFLARTWCDGTAVGPLARASFDLQKKYGAMFNCDYRQLDTLEVVVKENNKRRRSNDECPEWLDKESIVSTRTLGNTSNTAQVHPAKLTECFLNAALKKGSQLVIAQATGVEFSHDGKTPVGVKLQGKATIDCNTLIIAMGPWTSTASQWFSYHLPQIKADRAHSIVMEPVKPVSAHALFVSYTKKTGSQHDPEIYPRPDGTVYVCGYSDNKPLPESADKVIPNEESCDKLCQMARCMTSALEDCKPIIKQACYLPTPPYGVPCIGEVPGYKNVYMAAGHYCWGILNSAATGKALADLLVLGKSDIDLSPFNPASFL